MREKIFLFSSLILLILFFCPIFAQQTQPNQELPKKETCVSCHSKISPGIVKQWQASKHGKMNLNCTICHSADEGEVDAFKHYDEIEEHTSELQSQSNLVCRLLL